MDTDDDLDRRYPLLVHLRRHGLTGIQAEVAAPFLVLGRQLAASLPGGPEVTVALRKLVEAMDAAVRATRH
jgi:hypothetical protein